MILLILSPISGCPSKLTHVFKAARLGDVHQPVAFIGDVLHEEQHQDVVFVLASVRPCCRAVRRSFSRGSCRARIFDGHVVVFAV